MDARLSTHTSLLARLANRDDAEAWQAFSDRYRGLICGFARRRGLQPADCDDVFQEVMLSLSEALPRFRYDPRRGRFRSFLKTVTLNAIIDRQRGRAGESKLRGIDRTSWIPGGPPDVEQAWEAEWRQYHVRRALQVVAAEFNDNDYRAFRHYVLQQQDARRTAEAIGVSVAQVYQAKSRITRRLTALIELQMQEEG